jgi:hypothetical protein
MPWKFDQRERENVFRGESKRRAFRAGYSDGFHGYGKLNSDERNDHPRIYERGHQIGAQDRTTTDQS